MRMIVIGLTLVTLLTPALAEGDDTDSAKRARAILATFREEIDMVEEMFQDQKDTNIVMYCTGGIRCEKASAYLKHKGFKNVHQLEGGIIEYTRQAKAAGLRNKFIGKNFVFDERLAEPHQHEADQGTDENAKQRRDHGPHYEQDQSKQQHPPAMLPPGQADG